VRGARRGRGKGRFGKGVCHHGRDRGHTGTPQGSARNRWKKRKEKTQNKQPLQLELFLEDASQLGCAVLHEGGKGRRKKKGKGS